MPKIAADRLERIAGRLLVAAGASAAEADTVSRHLIAANLAGHDSHGVIHIPRLHRIYPKGTPPARRLLRHHPGEPDNNRRGRELGLWIHRIRKGDATDNRKGAPAKCRRRHSRAPGPRRASDRLSTDGRPSRHDRADDCRLWPGPKSVAPFGGVNRDWERIRSASPSPPIWMVPSTSTSQPPLLPAANWRSPSSAGNRYQPAG